MVYIKNGSGIIVLSHKAVFAKRFNLHNPFNTKKKKEKFVNDFPYLY